MKSKPILTFVSLLVGAAACASTSGPLDLQMYSLHDVEETFPDSVTISTNGKLEVEFCPDNTCDVFQASDAVVPSVMSDVVFLYLYYESDFYVLESWREKNVTKARVTEIAQEYALRKCELINEDRGRCVMSELMRKYEIIVYFGRYDESVRTITKKP